MFIFTEFKDIRAEETVGRIEMVSVTMIMI